MTDYLGMDVDGHVFGYNSNYAICRSTAYSFESSFNVIYVGQNVYNGANLSMRTYLKFDTTSLTPEMPVVSANIVLVCISDHSNVDFDVDIVKCDWSSNDPVTNNNKDIVYDSILVATKDVTWRNSYGISLNTPYTSPDLDTSWLNPGGYTYYGLRSNRDYDSIDPSGQEVLWLASQEHGTPSYRPVLRVTVASGSNFVAYFYQ